MNSLQTINTYADSHIYKFYEQLLNTQPEVVSTITFITHLSIGVACLILAGKLFDIVYGHYNC